MRSLIFAVLCSAALISTTSVWGEIEDWEFPMWIEHFEFCGDVAQTVEVWPGLGLVEEYRHLEREMLDDALTKGASSNQLQDLSEAFESGRRKGKGTEWREGAKVEDLTAQQLNDIVRGFRRIRQSCPDF